MNRKITAWVIAGCAAWFLTTGANAGLFTDDDAHKRIDLLTERLTQVEELLKQQAQANEQKTANGLMDLSSALDQIKNELSQIRGQQEVLNYKIAEIEKRQRDLYTDLDSRLRALEPTPSATPSLGNPLQPPNAGSTQMVASVGSTVGGTSASGEEKAYNDAMNFFKHGDYSGAAKAFAAFITAYPNSPQAASAQYWIGNSHFAQRNYKGAIAAQSKLLQTWPDSPKTPDAMLNMASAYQELGDRETAKMTLKSLISRYPTSEAASKARQRIK